jgi:hypothetical protein
VLFRSKENHGKKTVAPFGVTTAEGNEFFPQIYDEIDITDDIILTEKGDIVKIYKIHERN